MIGAGLRIIPFDAFYGVIYDTLDLFYINNVSELQLKIQAPFAFAGYIDNNFVKSFPFGIMIVRLSPVNQYSIKKLDRCNNAILPLCYNIVLDLKWLQQKYKHSAGKILKSTG